MSAGSLRDLVRTLNGVLSTPQPPSQLPEDVLNVIHTYLNRHVDIDGHDSARLNEELMNLHAAKVQGNPDNVGVFLAIFRALRPAIVGVEELSRWWDILVKPTFDSMGQAKTVIADARAIVLSVLAYDDDDDPTGQRALASSIFTDRLFEIFLEKTRLPTSPDKGAGAKEEQKHKFVSSNVEAVLLAYGKRKPKAFLSKVDAYMIQKEYRLQVLGLLCSYVRLQGPHLYHVLQTPLFDHLLQCLENDSSTTVISLALTILIMFMPHLCNSLGAYLPRLFIVYTRVLCWDKFGALRVEEGRFPGSRSGTPLSMDKESTTGEGGWQKLTSSFETAASTTPDVGDYFSFLYGLYPINFISFIREPYKTLDRLGYKDADRLDIEEDIIRQRTELYRQCHTLHPNFLTLTAETELSDQSRWMRVEPADVTAQCIGLVNNNIPAEAMRRRHPIAQLIPEALIRTEDIPNDSLLSQGDEPSGDDGEVPALFQNRKQSPSSANRTGPPSRDPKAPDSPTIPAAEGTGGPEDAHLHDMLSLQEQLQASFRDLKRSDDISPAHPSGPPPGYPGSATASPRLDAYVQSLNNNNMPRSPALRPAPTDTQGTIAYLQREIMLLKNDLNFERYLKQQHLSHIGHLQRKHIKESTAEAETQNLINTNKALKAKLEEAKKAYAASRQENLKSKNQAKKWEAELSAKIRALREEQKAWKADGTKQALEATRAEADHLRKLLEDSEAEGLRARQKLQSLNASIDEVNKLRTFVEHLSNKLTDYDSRAQDFEMQRRNEEDALQQVERMKMRLTSRDQELREIRRNYEAKIQELESRLNSMSNPMPQSPGPAFQGMIDTALSQANARFASLKKAHNNLLQRYTELEIKYIELQASQEIDSMHHGQSHGMMSQYGDMPSDNESTAPQHRNGRNIEKYRQQYEHSEDSLSPHSSYADSPGGGNYGRDYMSQGAPSVTGPMSPGNFGPPKYSAPGHMSPEPMPPPSRQGFFDQDQMSMQQLRHQASVPDSIATGVTSFNTSASDDARSMRTVKSATSSEKRKEKIKPQSEIRIRGRGGVQNIGKKNKDKDGEGEVKEPKPKKKSRFQTGAGLAGIRGFV